MSYRKKVDKKLLRKEKELDAMEDAIKKEDIIEALRHQMILEVLLK